MVEEEEDTFVTGCYWNQFQYSKSISSLCWATSHHRGAYYFPIIYAVYYFNLYFQDLICLGCKRNIRKKENMLRFNSGLEQLSASVECLSSISILHWDLNLQNIYIWVIATRLFLIFHRWSFIITSNKKSQILYYVFKLQNAHISFETFWN